MSTKKEKLIEEAQRLAVQGKLDKAIKAYQQVVALDPTAGNLRQRLAELLLKAGRHDEARTEFETIGKKFAASGFYLRAIAVYTQLKRYFPNEISITLTLAELNEKHGLVANALAEYKQVYDYHEKAANSEEALQILEKMNSVDQQNVNIMIKLAEAYFQQERPDEAYATFCKAASLLQERSDFNSLGKLDARIRQLYPDKSEFMLEVLSEQVFNGNTENAVKGLQTMLRTTPDNKRIWEMIITAYQRLQQTQKVKIAYQHYLKYFPGETSAILGLMTCFAREKDSAGTIQLLDHYEPALLASGSSLAGLEMIYLILEEVDPINLRVLEGLGRVLEASGKTVELAALTPKIRAIKGVAGRVAVEEPPVDISDEISIEADDFDDQASPPAGPGVVPANTNNEFDASDFLEMPGDSPFEDFSDQQPVTADTSAGDSTQATDDDLEIEVEFDDFVSFDNLLESNADDVSSENWLDSVDQIFDSVATAPRGVKFDKSLDTADNQAHYDLGLAFKEMGLYDEAISEFRQASADSARRIECLIFQGVCLRDKGDLETAEKVLRKLLKPDLSTEDFFSVKYELAVTCNVSGKKDDYIRLLTEIETASPNYRDVRQLIAAAGSNNDDLDFSDDDLKGFDL